MAIKADEISQILRQQIENYKPEVHEATYGTVIKVGDNIATIYGLSEARSGELLKFSNGIYGMVMNLEEDCIGCMVMGPDNDIREGDRVERTNRIADVPVGMAMFGRVVNALGQPIDGKGEIITSERRTIECTAPMVMDRQPVTEPMQTGLKAIDALVPIGRGQRELIIGDRQTGKTAIAIDAILNQKGTDVYCIYVAIGQRANAVATVVDTLKKHGVMDKCVVVAANANEPPSLLYLAPYTGCAIAEDLMYNGKHALIIYDDLSKHAKAYREISLLLRRPPGREAFPGDVFFLHSRLLERSAKLSAELGGGSSTALPIIETQLGDVSAYIPTNVISITDGQIYLDADLFRSGNRPAVDVGLSVSRVGGSAQLKATKQVAGPLRVDLAQYRSLAAYAKLSADELDQVSRDQLARGDRITAVLNQKQYVPMPVEQMVAVLFAVTRGYMDKVPVDQVPRYEQEFISFMEHENKDVLSNIKKQGKLDDAMMDKLSQCAGKFSEEVFAVKEA
ncbi:MAG: F0F1 ATP synthase subunit alpha [bacterium]|nr:F0F1 ATP synthase subunit alpha [bacterium]